MESAVAVVMTGHPEAAGAPLAVTDAAVAKLNEAVADGGTGARSGLQ